jgi:hypothetical protein
MKASELMAPAIGTQLFPDRLPVRNNQELLDNVSQRSGYGKNGQSNAHPQQIGPDNILGVSLPEFHGVVDAQKREDDHQQGTAHVYGPYGE